MTDGAGETGDALPGEAAAPASVKPAIRRLPPRLQPVLARLQSRWLGRIVTHGVGAFVRLDMFDRSMTIAAQFFTSVFPILILFTTWADSRNASWLADALDLPDETRSVLEDAIQGSEGAAFSVAGTVIVLASATSLSRALTRAFAAIWGLARPRSSLGAAWRWLAVVVVLTLSVVLVHTATEPLDAVPPGGLLPPLASFALDAAVALFVPWVLLSGAVFARRLAPGALVFALLMLAVRPATAAWLPHALEVSADRYGSIGVAFTYLACLYAASFCFLATAVIGQVIANDRGALGGWIRQGDPAIEPLGAGDGH